jgi:hypothetical protein
MDILDILLCVFGTWVLMALIGGMIINRLDVLIDLLKNKK